jgi:hypothetical protein
MMGWPRRTNRMIAKPAAALACLAMAAMMQLASPGAAHAADSDGAVVQDGIEYGPEQKLSGVYFTNFENSKFIQCGTPAECADWASREHEWANCLPAACNDLQFRVQELNGSLNKWGTFQIAFLGRRSVHRYSKKFIGDAESKVLLEKILQLQKAAP